MNGVSPAGRGGREPVLLQPVAQRDVLGVTERRRGQRLALELGGRGDPLRDDHRGAPGRGTGNDLDRGAAGLLPGVDGRVRADVGGVQLAGQYRRRLLGPGAEGGRLQRPGRAEVLGEEALLQRDQRGCVRDVLEKAQPDRHRRRVRVPGAAARTCRARRRGRAACRQQQGSADYRGSRDTSHLTLLNPLISIVYIGNRARFTIHRAGKIGNRPRPLRPEASAGVVRGMRVQLPSSLESCNEMPVTVGNLDRHSSSTATSASLAWLIW